MDHRTPPTRSATSRRQRAFTLTELIVVLVILGIIAAVAAFSYNAVTSRAQDAATETTLGQIAKTAVGSSSHSGTVAFTSEQVFADAAADAAKRAGAQITLTQNGGESLRPDKLSVHVDTGSGLAGLALRSPTGSCAVAYVRDTLVQTALWHGDQGRNCAGPVVVTRVDDGTFTQSPGAPPPVNLTAPQVQVTSQPGVVPAVVAWAAIPDADTYRIYLDGASTPIAAGTSLTATLDAGKLGSLTSPHTVTVVAVRGDGTPVGYTSPPSTPVTVYPCSNDMIGCAHSVDAASLAAPGTLTYTSVYDTTGATLQAGESTNEPRSLWWQFTPVATGNYSATMIAPTTDTSITKTSIAVYKNGSTFASLGTALAKSTSSVNATYLQFTATAGTTYLFRASDYYTQSAGRPFRLRIGHGEPNDAATTPALVPALAPDQTWTTTRDYTTIGAGMEAGEPGSLGNSLWWQINVPAQDSSYTVRVLDPQSGTALQTSRVHIYQNNGSAMGSWPLLGVDNTYNVHSSAYAVAPAGSTLMVKLAEEAVPTGGRFTLSVTRGPVNDVPSLATVATFNADGIYQSGPVSNANAGSQSPETGLGSYASVWWKFTAAADGTYSATLTQFTPVSGQFSYPSLAAYNDAATISAMGAPIAKVTQGSSLQFPVTAGQTYAVRVSGYDTSTQSRGTFNLLIGQGPANDAYATPTAVGALSAGTWSSADVDLTGAGVAPNEYTGNAFRTVWWTFTAPESRPYKVRILGPTTGTGPGDITRVNAYRDNGTGYAGLTYLAYGQYNSTYPDATFTATAGTTYRFMVLQTAPDATPGRVRLRVTAS